MYARVHLFYIHSPILTLFRSIYLLTFISWCRKYDGRNLVYQVRPSLSLTLPHSLTQNPHIHLSSCIYPHICSHSLQPLSTHSHSHTLILRTTFSFRFLSPQNVSLFHFSVLNDYWFQLFMDDLPMWGLCVCEREGGGVVCVNKCDCLC